MIEGISLTNILSIVNTIVLIFFAAYLSYFFSIKSLRKNFDFEKEKELNSILADLLNIWHGISNFEQLSELMLSEEKIAIPKNLLPAVLIKQGKLDESWFDSLDKSIINLKKYDPAMYYDLEGLGNTLNITKLKYIQPLVDHGIIDDYSNNAQEVIGVMFGKILSNIEDAIKTSGLEGAMQAIDIVELIDRHLITAP